MQHPAQTPHPTSTWPTEAPSDRPPKPECADPAPSRFPVFHQDTFFFMQEEQGISSGGLVALCVEGELLDPDRFLAAVARMMDRYPKCASRLVQVPSLLGKRFYWDPLPDAAARACFFHEPDPTLQNPEAMEARSLELLNVRLDLAASPPLEFHWLPYGDREGMLTFRFHHSLCDGIGAILLLKNLFGFYNGLPTVADDLDPTAPPAPIVEGPWLFKLWLLLRFIAFQMKRVVSYSFASPDKLFDPRKRSSGRLNGVYLQIDSTRLAYWLSGARSLGATLNELLIAACALAIERWKGERGLRCGTFRFNVNQNLRQKGRHYPAAENRSSCFPVWVSPRDRREPEALVRNVHRQVQECLRLRTAEALNLLGVVLKLPYSLARCLVAPLMNNPRIGDSFIVSNMGMIPVWESEGGHWFHLGRGRIVKLYYPGRPTDGIGAICIAASIPEGLQLSLLGMSGLLETTELQRLAQLVEAALDELATTGAVIARSTHLS